MKANDEVNLKNFHNCFILNCFPFLVIIHCDFEAILHTGSICLQDANKIFITNFCPKLYVLS